jgi:hypothetical protein
MPSFLFDTSLLRTSPRTYNSPFTVQDSPILVTFPSDEHPFQAIYFSGSRCLLKRPFSVFKDLSITNTCIDR